MKKRLMKNISLLMVSQVASYILLFIYNVLIARYLGVSDYGIFSFALAFVTIIAIFTDLGLNTILTREIAIHKQKTEKYTNMVFSIKLILVFAVLLFSVVFLWAMNYQNELFNVVFLITFSVIFVAFTNFFYAIFQAHEEMGYQAIGTFLNSVFLVAGILIVEYLNLNLLWVAFIYTLVSMMVLFYVFIFYMKGFHLPRLEFDIDFYEILMKDSLQVFLISLFVTIYIWIDSLILFYFQGNQATGLYSVAYRLMLALFFIPNAINYAVFPVMARLRISSPSKLKLLVEKYFLFMLMVTIPVCIGTTILADKIILLLYGNEYLGAILALQILIWSVLFGFTSSPYAELFISTKKQGIVSKITGICMIFNIIINLILIPQYSYIGASIATLLTNIVLGSFLIYMGIKSRYTTLDKSMLVKMTKILTSSLLVGVFIWMFKDLNLLILVPISILIYFILLYLLGIANKEEIENIYKLA